MKTQILILLALCSAFTGHSQAMAFCNVSITNAHHKETISFALPREVNVRHYRLEAGNDGTHFEVISTIRSKGNSVLRTTYNCDLAGYTYKYYRVAMVLMNAGVCYSSVITGQTKPADHIDRVNTPAANACYNALAIK